MASWRIMSSVNKVILVGRLGKDPELRYTPSGSPLRDSAWPHPNPGLIRAAKSRSAHNGTISSPGGKLAEICNQYLVKGKMVYIEGRLESREYTDRDGNKRRITEIVARDMVMLDSRGTAESKEDTAARIEQPH